jgi:hypothetical protein
VTLFVCAGNSFGSVHQFQPRLAQPIQQHLDILVQEDHPFEHTAAAVGLLVAYRLALVPGESGQSLAQALLRKDLQVFLLLSGTLLLWPLDVALEPRLLAVAFLTALVTLLILRTVLYPLFSLVGVELRLPAEPASEGQPEA